MAKSFHELSPRSQTIVFGLLCVATVAGAWQMLIGPMDSDLTARRVRLETLTDDVAKAQLAAARLPAVQKEVHTLETRLLETTAVIPDEKDPQDVLRNLHDMASDSLLDIASFKPKDIVTRTQYSEWPIELGIEGGYHDLGRFFDRIATMSRLMSISELDIKTKTTPNGRGTVSATCVATTFVFKKDIALTTSGGQP